MNRCLITIAGLVLLVVLLLGAAFTGGRILQRQAAATPGSSPAMSPDGRQAYASVELVPSKELPGEPLAEGVYVSRTDDAIRIGTGEISVTPQGSKYSGPEFTVVVTHDTTVYREATMKQFNGNVPPGSHKVDQILEPGHSDEIADSSVLNVWGEKSGDRIVASVLVYSIPEIMNKPGAGDPK